MRSSPGSAAPARCSPSRPRASCPTSLTLSQGAHRRHAAARRHHWRRKGVRRVLVGRPDACADARADLHGQCAGLRRGQCLARLVRRASRGSIRSRRSRAALSQGLAPCRGLPGVKDVRVKGAIGVVELDRIDNLNALRQRFVEEGVFIRPFGNVDLSHAGLHHCTGRACPAYGRDKPRGRRVGRQIAIGLCPVREPTARPGSPNCDLNVGTFRLSKR